MCHSKDPVPINYESGDEVLDYQYLVEELSYWNHVLKNKKFNASLKDYALKQLTILNAKLNDAKLSEQLKRSS